MILFILYVNACENFFFLEKLMENVFFSKKTLNKLLKK